MLDQDNNYYLISLNILITCLLDNVRILLKEVTCLSLLGVKELRYGLSYLKSFRNPGLVHFLCFCKNCTCKILCIITSLSHLEGVRYCYFKEKVFSGVWFHLHLNLLSFKF